MKTVLSFTMLCIFYYIIDHLEKLIRKRIKKGITMEPIANETITSSTTTQNAPSGYMGNNAPNHATGASYNNQVPAPGIPYPPKKKPDFIASLLIGLAIVISSAILGGAFVKYKTDNSRSISATGSASVDFDADLIVWRGYFTAYSESSSRAYSQIKKEATWVEDYLKNKGLSSDDYVFSTVDISESTVNDYDENGNYIRTLVEGYNLSQNVVISSNNIDLVEEISRDISTLLDNGVQLTSGTPEYYCTGLDEIKLDLIDKATENARARIDIMARQSGANIGKLRSSNLGVFQITAQNSGTSYYSYDGYLDTTSRHKTASITVRLEYDVK